MKIQDVTGALRKAGMTAANFSGRNLTSGYKTMQINKRAVSVFYYDFDNAINHQEVSEKMESILIKAGFKVQRPFPDKTVLGVHR